MSTSAEGARPAPGEEPRTAQTSSREGAPASSREGPPASQRTGPRTPPQAEPRQHTPVRQQRGRRRREALLAAGVSLLETGGLRAVSHRAVAERAGVPVAATTYYFSSLDELVEQAFERLVRDELAWIHRRVPGAFTSPPPPERLAQQIVAALFPRDEAGLRRLASLYELCAQAAREPALRPLLAMWTDGLVEVATEALRHARYPHADQDARLLVGLVDGLLLEAFERPPHESLPRATETVARALTLIRGSAGRA